MRIVIDITHPAHVHFFRGAIAEFQKRGHAVAVTAREKDVTIQLLGDFGIPFTGLSKAGTGVPGLIGELMLRDIRLWRFCRRFKPDVLTAISGVFAAHAGFLSGKPVVVWDDTEHQRFSHILTYPFVNAVYSPDCYTKSLGRKHHLYPGLHELAYLHPERFTPDAEIVRSLGVDPDEKYCIVRFVSWRAHHDVGQHGFAGEEKSNFLQEISKYARVYITSESPLPDEFEPYRLKIPAHLIHQVMAYSVLYVGEGATMATESALLGVPAVYVNTLRAGTIDMLGGYGLIKQTTDTQQALEYCVEILKDPKGKEGYASTRERLLADKIDVTKFVVDTIEQTAKKHQSK